MKVYRKGKERSDPHREDLADFILRVICYRSAAAREIRSSDNNVGCHYKPRLANYYNTLRANVTVRELQLQAVNVFQPSEQALCMKYIWLLKF